MPEIKNPPPETPSSPQSEPEAGEKDYYELPNIPISRRRFLQGLAGGAGGVVLGGILAKLGIFNPGAAPKTGASPSPFPSASENIPTATETPEPSTVETSPAKGSFKLGEKTDLSLNEMGLNWTPDGHITYFTTPEGKKRYFISSGVSTFMLDTDGNTSLKDTIKSGTLTPESFKNVYKPDSSLPYRQDYAGITSVLQLDKNNPMHLFAVAHCERRTNPSDSGTYTATVVGLQSSNGGESWEDMGPLITGTDPIEPGIKPSGAGQPAAITKDGYLYIMYIDWSGHNKHSDQLYLAKAKDNGDGTIGNIESLPEAVIPVPSGGGYAALPSLSLNDDGNYWCVFETAKDFRKATSKDLTTWSEPEVIFDYKQNNGEPRGVDMQKGEEFITYPTLLSEDKPSDGLTDNKGELYYASKPFAGNSHNLKSVDFTA